MAGKGLVIGKFLPPHRGHHHLIDTALSQVDRLTVIVCGRAGDPIDPQRRAAWLREIHPRANVVVVEDCYPSDDSALWARMTLQWLGGAPDVVFTSEAYGNAYAQHLGSRHVLVDPDRRHVPCSGSAVRADPFAWWQYLEPPVRAHFVRRVCVVGAESTGKTTLVRKLAERFETVWVPEYGREYTERKYARGDFTWRTEEFVHIAEQQNRMEDDAVRFAYRVMFTDTDAFATSIWHERYMGGISEEVERVAAARPVDLYLIPDVRIPFVQDGIRDGEHLREWMHRRFLDELERRGWRFLLLEGSYETRFEDAAKAVDRLLEEPWPGSSWEAGAPGERQEEHRVVTALNSEGYPAPAGMTADPVVFAPLEGSLSVLLVPRLEPPFLDAWSLPGGFMNAEEKPEETAQRKLTEKTGIGSIYLEQLATYGSPRRDPRGWIPSVAYLALIDGAVLREGETSARWFPVDALPELAFDHRRIIRDGIERLRGKLWYSSIAAPLLPERFTLADARLLYEAISGVPYDVPNFRRAMEQSGMIRETGERRQGAAGRPATLYEFVDRRPSWNARRSRIPAARS